MRERERDGVLCEVRELVQPGQASTSSSQNTTVYFAAHHWTAPLLVAPDASLLSHSFRRLSGNRGVIRPRRAQPRSVQRWHQLAEQRLAN